MADESPYRTEPLFLDEIPPDLADLAARVAQAAERVGGGLPGKTLASLSDLVRLMNCYYSNLIEGHHTRPRDVDAVLRAGPGTIPLTLGGDRDRGRASRTSFSPRANSGVDRWTVHVWKFARSCLQAIYRGSAPTLLRPTTVSFLGNPRPTRWTTQARHGAGSLPWATRGGFCWLASSSFGGRCGQLLSRGFQSTLRLSKCPSTKLLSHLNRL